MLVFVSVLRNVLKMEYKPQLKAWIAHAEAKVVVLLTKLSYLSKHLLFPVVAVDDYPKLVVILDVVFIDERLQLSVYIGRAGVVIFSVQHYELHVGGAEFLAQASK